METSSVAISPAQSRMARAALGLTVDDMAEQAAVSRASVLRLEKGVVVRPGIRAALQAAYEGLGVAFTAHGVELTPARLAA